LSKLNAYYCGVVVETNLTTPADTRSVLGSHTWAEVCPGAITRGTMAGFSSFVKLITASQLAPLFAIKPIAFPVAGLVYAVIVCGSNPMLHGPLVGVLGT